MPIYSCKGCVPPERHPGCHSTCPKYLEEKAKHDALKEKQRKEHDVAVSIMDQRGRAVRKAMQHRRKGKCCEQ